MAVGHVVAQLGDAGTAGVPVVDDDGGQAGVGLEEGGHAADVPPVADGEQRQHPDRGVLGGVQGAGGQGHRHVGLGQQVVGERVPEGPGDEERRGQVELLAGQDLAGEAIATLVAGDLAAHLDVAEVQGGAPQGPALVGGEDAHLGLGLGQRVVAAVGRGDPGHGVVEVEVVDLERPALVEVGRPRVDEARGAALVDGAHQVAGGQGDAHLAGRAAPQADAVAREAPGRPDRPGLGAGAVAARTDLEAVVHHQRAHAFGEDVGRPVGLVGPAEGQLVGGAGEVGAEHERVGGVDDRRLGRAGEHLVGMGHEPLVELVLARHEHGERLLGLAPRPPRLLPEGRDGAGEAVEHAGVEPADVDPQLEGRGGHHALEAAREELVLDGPALDGEVAAPVGGHGVGQCLGQAAPHVGGHDLGALAAAAERDGAPAVEDELGGDGGALAVGGHPGAVTGGRGAGQLVGAALVDGDVVAVVGLVHRGVAGGGVSALGSSVPGRADPGLDASIGVEARIGGGVTTGGRVPVGIRIERGAGAGAAVAGVRGRDGAQVDVHVVLEGRVPEGEQPLAPGGAVVGDLGHVQPAQLRGQAAGLADGGRREDEGGVGAVVGAEATQTAQQVGHVGAEDASQRVQLVDDDVVEAQEVGVPLAVVGEDPAVEHLGVGEHHVGLRPHPRPLFWRAVAVVGAGDEAGHLQVGEAAELVLREGLGGEDEQGRS